MNKERPVKVIKPDHQRIDEERSVEIQAMRVFMRRYSKQALEEADKLRQRTQNNCCETAISSIG